MQEIIEPATGSKEYLDARTIQLEEISSADSNLPDEYTNSFTFPVLNQIHHPFCVLFGTANAVEMYEKKMDMPYRKVSRAFLTIMAKKEDGLPIQSGTWNIQGMKVLNKYGYLYADEFDKDLNTSSEEYIKDTIPENLKELAKTRCLAYGGVPTASFDQWKQAIYKYGCTTAPINLSKDWWTVNGVRNYDVPDPIQAPKYPLDYGHTMLAIGYNTNNVKIVNSWGETWSRDGFSDFSPLDYKPHSMAYFIIGPKDSIKIPVTPKVTEFTYHGVSVKYGERNNNVKELQIALRMLGFLTSDEFLTGFYGDKTKEAVYRFQFKYMQAYLNEINLLGGKQVGKKTIKEIQKQLTMLKNKTNQVNSGSDIPLILQSSQDPNQISMRAKGLMLAILPIGLLIANQMGYSFTQEQGIEIITVVTGIISAGMYVYGLVRASKSEPSI